MNVKRFYRLRVNPAKVLMSDNDHADNNHSLFLDLLRTLQKAEDQESAIRAVMDMVAGLFRPERICFMPERAGKVMGDCDPWPMEARLMPDQMVKLLPSKRGFALALKEKGRRIGTLLVDGVEHPQELDALEMALSNIRHMDELHDSRSQLAQLSESLGVANKILRHDIANELLVISSSLDLYKQNGRERDLLRAQSSLQRMQSIISQMRELDSFLLSRSDMVPTSLRRAIDKVMPSLELPYTIEGEATVLADPALNAVIENLARNAKRHGKAGKVEFTITMKNGVVTLVVRDDGKGLPEENVVRIFMEGVAFGESRGTGLGLYLVRRTMERYGGSISAGNDDRGGARFELTFRSAVRP
jgi:signal transduction histidine kinase